MSRPLLPRRNRRAHLARFRAGGQHGPDEQVSCTAGTPADILVGALEDEQMHRRATAIRDFYRQHSFVLTARSSG